MEKNAKCVISKQFELNMWRRKKEMKSEISKYILTPVPCIFIIYNPTNYYTI